MSLCIKNVFKPEAEFELCAVRFGNARYGQLHSGGVSDGGEEPAVVGVEDPPLKAVKGLLEGGLEVFAEEEGLINRGIAAKVDPGVETLVALKDEDVGGVETLDGRDDVKFEGWPLLLDTFGEGTRGWSPSVGKTSFRAPDDHLGFDILIRLLKNEAETFSFPTPCALPQECLVSPLRTLLFLLNFSPEME